MIDFRIDGKICRFKLAKTLLSGKIQMGTELSPLTRGTSASARIAGSFERHVVSPTTKNCCETSLACVERGVARDPAEIVAPQLLEA